MLDQVPRQPIETLDEENIGFVLMETKENFGEARSKALALCARDCLVSYDIDEAKTGVLS